MENDIRFVYIEFNELAQRHFFRLYNEFQNSVGDIDRKYEENVFQMSRAKYSSLLKRRLEESAKNILDKFEGTESAGRLRFNFTESISYYLKEFTRKSKLI